MAESEGGALNIGLALLGSVLMFVGWVLAIVGAFHFGKHLIIPLILGIIGFAIVLIPAGLDSLGTSREEGGGKRGAGTVVISILPAAALFFIAVIAFPLSALYRGLAMAAELLGMAAYGWAFWAYHHPARPSLPTGRNEHTRRHA